MERSRSRENQNAANTRWIANATVALLPVLACFLGGATQKWEEGLVITLLALCLLVRPPRFSLGALTNLVLLALFILAAVAFFPPRWFFQPEWRALLVNDFGIQLHGGAIGLAAIDVVSGEIGIGYGSPDKIHEGLLPLA